MQDNRNKILLSVNFVVGLVAIVLLIAWTTGPFFYHFAHTGLVNLYSYFQLFAIAFTSFLACRILEKENSLKWHENPSARPFFISALGFLFLGLDDLLSIHENFDKLIHLILRIKETWLTDHIDDFILLSYGIIAVFFMKDFIREFKRHPYMVKLMIYGLTLFFIMFSLDFVANNIETFEVFFKGMSWADLRHWRDIYRMAEDSFELLGEAFLLSAFVAALVDIKQGKNKIKP